MNGEAISRTEVRIVERTPEGFWLALEGEKLYLPYSDFPWFCAASDEQLKTVQRLSEDHLYWPLLDMDISIASIRSPQDFPLLSVSSASA